MRFTTAMLFAVAFLLMFTIGGLSGITFAVVPIDWQLTDTYFVVAHFHYVLFGGTAFALFAGVYYWFPKITGRMLDERWGKVHFWLTFIGFNLTFFDPALPRDARDAAAGVHVSRAAGMGSDEHDLDHRRVHARLRGADLS